MNDVVLKVVQWQYPPEPGRTNIHKMDNASYHSAQSDKTLSRNWRKQEIQKWLITKAELPEKIAPFKHEVWTGSNNLSLGHEVVRLPPYIVSATRKISFGLK